MLVGSFLLRDDHHSVRELLSQSPLCQATQDRPSARLSAVRLGQSNVLAVLVRALSCLPKRVASIRCDMLSNVLQDRRECVWFRSPHSRQIVRQHVRNTRDMDGDSDGVQPQDRVKRDLPSDEAEGRAAAG